MRFACVGTLDGQTQMGILMNAIVCTTINEPTEAMLKYDALTDWTLIVVGDKKTPKDYQLKRGIYISPDEQEQTWPELSGLVGWDCIQRRNFGFLRALEMGASLIATVDDDNIPMSNWGQDVNVGKQVRIPRVEVPLVGDPLFLTEHNHLWHRGFPLQELSNRQAQPIEMQDLLVDVEAFFWNGDPDVDAIGRMIYRPEVEFANKAFPFAFSKFSPFNSQNTVLSPQSVRNYCMIPGIGRMDDIWGGYYLQALGFTVVYREPSVVQVRNEHDLTRDFEGEVLGYVQTPALLRDLAQSPESIHRYLPHRSSEALRAYIEMASKA